jgi:hypothetical protein
MTAGLKIICGRAAATRSLSTMIVAVSTLELADALRRAEQERVMTSHTEDQGWRFVAGVLIFAAIALALANRADVGGVRRFSRRGRRPARSSGFIAIPARAERPLANSASPASLGGNPKSLARDHKTMRFARL